MPWHVVVHMFVVLLPGWLDGLHVFKGLSGGVCGLGGRIAA